jgi:hypothetical protein
MSFQRRIMRSGMSITIFNGLPGDCIHRSSVFEKLLAFFFNEDYTAF